MTDSHPENFEIEIDRDTLCQYLRSSWFRIWMLGLPAFGLFFGFMFGISSFNRKNNVNWDDAIENIIIGVTIVPAGAAILAFILYYTLSHGRARREADALRLRVCGPFLRYNYLSGMKRIDQKIHFNAVIDYAVVESKGMDKFNLKTLEMSTSGNGLKSFISITGIKDCEKTRDLLAKVDNHREDLKA